MLLKTSIRSGAVCATALLTAVAPTVPATAVAPIPSDAIAAPVVWGECVDVPPEQRPFLSCAIYQVPLDHEDPGRGSVGLAMMRRSATDQSRRVGSLFLNPGGPGGSGFTLPLYADTLFQPEVLQRFDVIGFDPRGVGASAPLRCFKTNEEFRAVWNRIVKIPITEQEIAATLAAQADYTDACALNGGPLLEHMSTADVAKDMDAMRQGVGEQQLNFAGFSYGSFLGATYANLFPQHSRAIVLDGNVDPELWTTDGVEYERQRTRGFEFALDAFLERCAKATANCAFSQGDPRAKFEEIRRHIRTSPVTLPVLGRIDINSFTTEVSRSLYSSLSFRQLASFLQRIYAVLHPDEPRIIEPTPTRSGRPQFGVPNDPNSARIAATPYLLDDSYHAVNCVDKPFPRTPSIFPTVATQWEQESPAFGRYRAFDLLRCATWPVPTPHRYDGPWNQATPNPVLLFGNYYDPATNYEFAQRMAAELGSSRLVSVDAHGHTILGTSKCTDDITTRYLTTLQTPPANTLCHPDTQPFE